MSDWPKMAPALWEVAVSGASRGNVLIVDDDGEDFAETDRSTATEIVQARNSYEPMRLEIERLRAEVKQLEVRNFRLAGEKVEKETAQEIADIALATIARVEVLRDKLEDDLGNGCKRKYSSYERHGYLVAGMLLREALEGES